MRTSALLALTATSAAVAQETQVVIPVQGLTGVADFLGQVQAQIPTQGLDAVVAQFIPPVTQLAAAIFPQVTTVGDLDNLLFDPKLLVPAIAYAKIPPGVLNSPEYYVALNAAPEVLKIVQSDLRPLMEQIPQTLALTDLQDFVASNSEAIGSGIASLIATGIPQAQSILTTLAASASAFGIPSATGCSGSPTASAASATFTPVPPSGAAPTSSQSFTIPNPSPVPTTIVTGSADKNFVGKAAVVGGAILAVAILL